MEMCSKWKAPRAEQEELLQHRIWGKKKLPWVVPPVWKHFGVTGAGSGKG